MDYLGIPCHIKNRPALDSGFIPFAPWRGAYLAEAHRPVRIAVERQDGQTAVFDTRLRDSSYHAANLRFLERTVKLLLWSVGGWRVRICGCDELTEVLRHIYCRGGGRAFDADFMETVFQRPFVLEAVSEADFPAPRSGARRIGGHLNGCRIGFDAGGSDRKVSAVIDGKTVYSEEVVWHPKTQTDPAYHYAEIVSALRTAASKLPRVDGIGVSSAGVFIGNAPMVSSLFISVPPEARGPIHTIYDRAAAAIGDVPVVVANDGDVTALAGAMSLRDTGVMGLAMGTSEAAGYVNREGSIPGWFNELAFAPVDLNPHAARDEWSGDVGVGCKYFSQDAVSKLAPAAGIPLDDTLTPAEKLTAVQQLAEQGDDRALAVFRDIGVYLGHTLPLYASVYDLKHLLVLGRVASGIGGEQIIAVCRRVLAEEYPALAVSVTLPDEQFRRVGQSMAAASLPEV